MWWLSHEATRGCQCLGLKMILLPIKINAESLYAHCGPAPTWYGLSHEMKRLQEALNLFQLHVTGAEVSNGGHYIWLAIANPLYLAAIVAAVWVWPSSR
jgi:hypothetical protein